MIRRRGKKQGENQRDGKREEQKGWVREKGKEEVRGGKEKMGRHRKGW